jgi:hypothetical protein
MRISAKLSPTPWCRPTEHALDPNGDAITSFALDAAGSALFEIVPYEFTPTIVGWAPSA